MRDDNLKCPKCCKYRINISTGLVIDVFSSHQKSYRYGAFVCPSNQFVDAHTAAVHKIRYPFEWTLEYRSGALRVSLRRYHQYYSPNEAISLWGSNFAQWLCSCFCSPPLPHLELLPATGAWDLMCSLFDCAETP